MKVLRNSAAILILLIESFVYTAFLLAADDDINGLGNALSMRYVNEYIVFGTIFMILLSLLYVALTIALTEKKFMTFTGVLLVFGLAVGGFLSVFGAGAGTNTFLYFLYRSACMAGVLGVSVAISWAAGKVVFLVSDRNKIPS
jgi:hypothetical protein